MPQPDLTRIRERHEAVSQATGPARQDAGWDENTQRLAELAVEGKLTHMDQVVQIGRRDIDWSAGHVAHHTWKSKPNRFIGFVPLLAGFRATQDARYAEALRDYIADWVRAHPVIDGRWEMVKPDNGLNLPIRVNFWRNVLAACAPDHGFDQAFAAAVIDSIRGQLNWIAQHLSDGGNFRMVQAMALVQAGLVFDDLDEAPRWRTLGVRVLNDAARRQILPDGAHIECTGGYHTWMTQVFGQCLDLQGAFPELGFRIREADVLAMHDYALASTRPNGTFIGLNDIEGKDTGEHQNKPAAARRAFREAHGHPPETMPEPRQVFPHARQAMLRDGWGPDAMLVTFDCSRWGSAHAHLARNAVTLHARGRSMVVDPGRLEYEMSNPLGPYGKSTPAHATVNLNGWNQFTGEADRFDAFTHPEFSCVIGRYTGGYWPGRFGWWYDQGVGPGIAAFHDRAMFWRTGRWMAVVDDLTRWPSPEGGPAHQSPTLAVNWQLAACDVSVDADGRGATATFGDAALRLVTPLAPDGARYEVHTGETDPHRGWVRGDRDGFRAEPAPLLSLAARPWDGFVDTVVTVLIPHAAEQPPPVSITAHGDVPGKQNTGALGHLRLAWADGTVERVWWSRGYKSMIGRAPAGPDAASHESAYETDGLVLFDQQSPNQPPLTQAIDATFCDPA